MPQQVHAGPDEVGQLPLHLMPGHQPLAVGIDPAAPARPVGRIANRHLEAPGRKILFHVAHVSPYHANPLAKAVQGRTPHCPVDHGLLQLEADHLHPTVQRRQGQGDDPVSGTQVNDPFPPPELDETRQQQRVQREPEAARR